MSKSVMKLLVGFLLSFTHVFACSQFLHPGLLQTAEDFDRIQENVNAGTEPWITGWNRFLSNGYSNPDYTPNPAPVIYRGSDGTHAQNYPQLYQDIAAAYALAVRWSITKNDTFGEAAIRVIDAWSSTLTGLGGDVDVYLAAGIYGYEFAQAGELMRDYAGWPEAEFNRFKNMMVDVFYSVVNTWFEQHENWGSYARGVYPGWDLSQIAAAVSIGVLADNETIYHQGLDWFYNGTGNGQIQHAVPFTHVVDGQVLGQTLESGRDQGHNMLDIALLAAIGKIAYNQGDDLFAYNNSIILAAAEYVAKYNLGHDVPYTPYNDWPMYVPSISNASRGDIRPTWELLYNHYGVLKGQNVTWTKQYRDLLVEKGGGAEGGCGDFGPNSGGYDQLGWGTLLYTL